MVDHKDVTDRQTGDSVTLWLLATVTSIKRPFFAGSESIAELVVWNAALWSAWHVTGFWNALLEGLKHGLLTQRLKQENIYDLKKAIFQSKNLSSSLKIYLRIKKTYISVKQSVFQSKSYLPIKNSIFQFKKNYLRIKKTIFQSKIFQSKKISSHQKM